MVSAKTNRNLLLMFPLALSVLAIRCSIGRSPAYGLPITLGASFSEVREILGRPNEVVKPPKVLGEAAGQDIDNLTLEYFYSSGIVGRFDREKLFGITLNTHSDYQGFLIYSGSVVNGVKLTDRKETILSKLGKPTKIEDDLSMTVDPDVPVVWPKESRYYWRFADYTVQVDFLRQAQKLDDTHTLHKDDVSLIQVYK